MTGLEAIEKALRDAGRPLSIQQITERALNSGSWRTDAATPHMVLSAQLSMNIKKADSMFERVGRGLYGLRSWSTTGQRTIAPQTTEQLAQQAQSDETADSQSVTVPVPVPLTREATAPSSPLSPETMSFTDAAEWVLQRSGDQEPMYYKAIAEEVLREGLIATASQAPAGTLYAAVLGEIKRQQQRGETPRFTAYGKGMIGLSAWEPDGLTQQIEQHNRAVRQNLLQYLHEMPPKDFEALVGRLLVSIGFEDAEVTQYSGDGGVDVRGTLVVGGVIRIRMAVQAKRYKNNIQSPVVQQVRGSLGTHDQGLIITTSDFSAGAREEAQRPNAVPVALMNGAQLVALLVEHTIGVQRTSHDLIELADLSEPVEDQDDTVSLIPVRPRTVD